MGEEVQAVEEAAPKGKLGLAWAYLVEMSMDSAPGVGDPGDLHKFGVLVPLTLFYMGIFVTTLFYFTIQGAKQIASQKFLSLTAEDGFICTDVPLYVTATFYGDLQGRWSTNPDYQANASFYQLQFGGAAVNQASFQSNMRSFSDQIKIIGEKMAQRDSLYSLLSISSFASSSTDGTALSFSANVSPVEVFTNLKVYAYGFFNHRGRCVPLNESSSATNSTVISVKNSRFENSIVVTFDGLVPNPSGGIYEPCPLQLPSLYHLLGRKGSGTSFSFHIDIRSLVDAVAINMGLTTKDGMNEVDLGFDPSTVGFPKGALYVDPYYSNFAPIFCLSDEEKGGASNPDVCFLAFPGIASNSENYGDILSYSLWYPLMVSFGDFVQPTVAKGPCQCPRDIDLPQCNVADFLVTMFYDTGASSTDGTANNTNTVKIGKHFQSFLIADSENGDVKLAKEVYKTAMFAASAYYDNNVTDPRLTTELNSICPDKQCAALVVELFQESAFSPISSSQLNYYAIAPSYITGTNRKRIMCSDVLYVADAMAKLIDMPPTELVQPFLNCHNEFKTALLTSIGVAQGYAQLASGVIITVVGFFVIQYVNRVKAAGGNPEDMISKPKNKEVREKKVLMKTIRAIQDDIAALKQQQQQQSAAASPPLGGGPSPQPSRRGQRGQPRGGGRGRPRGFPANSGSSSSSSGGESGGSSSSESDSDSQSDSDVDGDTAVFGRLPGSVPVKKNDIWCFIPDMIPIGGPGGEDGPRAASSRQLPPPPPSLRQQLQQQALVVRGGPAIVDKGKRPPV